jgi:hypothetical protein
MKYSLTVRDWWSKIVYISEHDTKEEGLTAFDRYMKECPYSSHKLVLKDENDKLIRADVTMGRIIPKNK